MFTELNNITMRLNHVCVPHQDFPLIVEFTNARLVPVEKYERKMSDAFASYAKLDGLI